MKQLDNGTWVLVADGEKALFLENVTDAQNPTLQVRVLKEQENPPSREQATGAPGRVFQSQSGTSRAYGEADWHYLEKMRFADDLADLLYLHAHRGRFERLVIVAPPQVLGELRAKLKPEVSQRVVAEIAKTLTNHPLPEIEKILLETLGK